MSTVSTVVGGISFWYAQEGTPAPREPLPGDTNVDVCIVGGGYTGLWTAYYLKKAVPFLNITVLEAKFCGYGASGRNGGWLYNGIAGRDRYAELHGHEAAVRLQKAMNETVGEVVRTAAEEKIDADIHQGGVLEVAHTPAQLARLKDFHSVEIAFGESDRVLRGARETAERVQVTGSRRLHLDPARRPAAPGQAGQGARGRGGGARRHHPRVDAGHRDQAQARRHPVRHGPRPVRPALHRGLHREPQGPEAHLAPDELLHDRHRAAARPDLGRDRLGGPRDPRRHGPRLLLRPAHRRRPHRARRPRLPVPLRLGHRQRRPHPARHRRRPARPDGPALPRHGGRPRRPRLVGRPRRPARLVCHRHARPLHGPRGTRAVTSARASPPPTSPPAPCAT